MNARYVESKRPAAVRDANSRIENNGRPSAGRRPGKLRRLLRRDGGARMIIGVVLLLFVVLSYRSFNLYQKKLSYDKQITMLEEQIASEEARTAEIDAYEEYVGTDEYVERIARDRLGLVYPNEILFRPEE